MGRGPGLWQRVILDALEDVEAVPTTAVAYAVRDAPTRSDFVAVRRAARTLAEAGKVRAIYMYLPTHDETRSTPQLVVTRTDSQLQGTVADMGGTPEWITTPPTKVGQVQISTRVLASIMGVSPSTISRDARRV